MAKYDKDGNEIKEGEKKPGASFGDPSHSAAPVDKKAKKRKADLNKDGHDAHNPPTGVKTKAGMINAMVKKMNVMDSTELKNSYLEFMDESGEVEIDDNSFDDDVTVKDIKVTAEDIDLDNEVNSLFEDLEEEDADKARTLFVSAVVEAVNNQVEKLAVETESDFEATMNEEVQDLTEKLSDYLDYIASQFIEENRLAIEQGVRADLVESFMKGMKDLFEEHYVDVPSEKVDVVEELLAKVDDLTEQVNSATENNVKLSKKIRVFEMQDIFDEVAEDLTESQAARLKTLAEGVEFNSASDYQKRLNMLKDHYFDLNENVSTSIVMDDGNEPMPLEEETNHSSSTTDPRMNNFADYISRTVRK